jgi:FkbM family methyltransferase
MRIPTVRKIPHKASTLLHRLQRDPDRFLKRVPGVIHVGANQGQERDLYDRLGLRVVWIEPIPEVFAVLTRNIQDYPRQVAFQYLVTDRDDSEEMLNIANNEGASSSILKLKLHVEVWPDIAYERAIAMRSVTLTSLLKRESIDVANYPALVMDVQGSELLVLKGAVEILPAFRFIKTEVPDFEAYEGCCQLRDINSFLGERGFREFSRRRFATRRGGGNYYDIVYERRAG